MKLKAPESFTAQERIAYYDCPENLSHYLYGTNGGWKKDLRNPVLGGGDIGTCFDLSVLHERGVYKMWFSWRTHTNIGYSVSADGVHWSEPVSVLDPVPGSPYEADEINRPVVIFKDGYYHMWYSGQMRPYREEGVSVICYAKSEDGIHWTCPYDKPVLEASEPWEMHALMCPHVLFDEKEQLYKMWYSAGSNHEPDAIGYAVSRDGLHWDKYAGNPVLTKNETAEWEQYKVVACQVIPWDGWYYMFYVGHMHEERASVGLARSRTGYDGWEKHPANPLIAPEKEGWDAVSVYKPFAVKEEMGWRLWYNGAAYDPVNWVLEQIGIAELDHDDLWK